MAFLTVVNTTAAKRGGIEVTKIVDCNKVNPASGCQHVVRGETEEELLKNAAEHAKAHGMEPTPELLEVVKGHIEEEK
jgi:predicted small metal-binding protein